jgi:hypothetical protein
VRYIYVVAGLVLVIVGISGVTFLKPGPPYPGGAVRVNDRIIPADDFRKAYEEKASSCPVPPEKRQFLDDLVTREILIQEAKRLNLDRDEPFRRSIQNYYEQTLLKNLTQKKMSEIKVSVSEDEISSHYANMGRTYELGVITLTTEQEAMEAVGNFPSGSAEKRKLRLDEIPPEILEVVLALKMGEVSHKPVPCDKGYIVFKLEGYGTAVIPPLNEVRDEIIRDLEEKKKKSEMERWLDGLKKKSRISIDESLLR